jgi:hypothetical protein
VKPGLLREFAHDGLTRGLARLEVTAREAPMPALRQVVGATDEQVSLADTQDADGTATDASPRRIRFRVRAGARVLLALRRRRR